MAAKKKDLAYFGSRGDNVRVFLALDDTLVRVQHRAGGKVRLTKSWPNTPRGKAEAKTWAEAYWSERTKPVASRRDLTLAEVWRDFTVDQFAHLRVRTQEKYTEDFQHWMDQFGATTPIAQTTPQHPGIYRRAREQQGLGVRTIRGELGTVRTVYRWAAAHQLIETNPLADYLFKVGKDQRPVSPPEYSGDEFRKILAQLDPAKAKQWRAWVALVLCGQQGARQNAVLHLQLDDVTLGFHDERGVWQSGVITWRARWDKNGTEWEQPLRFLAQIAIEIALEWRERTGYDGPWLLPPAQPTRNKGETYDQQSLWMALQKAEDRAGVEKKEGRAAHGLRKLLAGDVWEESGDALLAIRSIGDKDPKRIQEYTQTRDHRVRDTFAALDRAQTKKEQG